MILNARKYKLRHRVGKDKFDQIDYSKYRFTARQQLLLIGCYIVLDLLLSCLFYNALVASIILAPGYIIFARICAQWLKQRRLRQLKLQFREWMMVLYSMIASGASLETSFLASSQELKESIDKGGDMLKELDMMEKKMAMNISAISCLEDFALRAGDDDIYSFYEIMNIARQQGGSMRQIVRNAIDRINEKIEMECEIETVIAAKKHEFLIMVCIPLAMIVYMRLGSPELMVSLYSGIAGRMIMTVALAVYVFAVYWGLQITRIEI